MICVAVTLEIIALPIYLQVDNIINVDLYNYGLQLNLSWILEYWSNYRIVLACLICAPIAMALSLMPYYVYSRENTSKWTNTLLPLISAGFLVTSIYYILQIDNTVNITQYQYGLQLSQEWASKYWLVTRTTLAMIGASIAISAVVALVTWKTNKNES